MGGSAGYTETSGEKRVLEYVRGYLSEHKLAAVFDVGANV